MKTKITILKASLFALFLIISNAASAEIYYTCSGSTLSLTTPVVAGITYAWDVKPAAGGASLTGYPSPTAPTSLPASGSYTVYLVSTQTDPNSGICAPDVVENTFNVLPALAMALNAPTHASYCAANSTVTSSDVTLGTVPTLPAGSATDLELEYTYSVNNGTTTVDGTSNDTNGTPYGTIDATTGKYTLQTKVAGTYTITGTVKYKQKTGFTNALLGSTGCVVNSTLPQQITVTPTPAKPIITISAS